MWYYSTGGQKNGPISEEEVADLIRTEDLGREDLVWTTGMDEWKKVSEVDEILPDPPPLPDGAGPPELPNREDPREDHGGDADERDFREEQKSQGRVSGKKGTHKKSPASSVSTNRADQTEDGAPDLSDISGGSTSDSAEEYAGFGKRLAAFAIDNVFLLLATLPLFLLILPMSNPNEVDLEKLARAIGLFGGSGYFIFFEASYKQATFGKQLLGLRVVDMNHGRIGLGKAIGRHLGKILSGAIFLIGYIMAAFTEKNQALHDKLSGCLVLEKEGGPSFFG